MRGRPPDKTGFRAGGHPGKGGDIPGRLLSYLPPKRRTTGLLALLLCTSLAVAVPATASTASGTSTTSARSAATAGHQAMAKTRAEAGRSHRYSATIVLTAGGVPHITGANFGDIGFGFGYIFAKDDICTMANDYVTVEGDRSRYFGAGRSYTVVANGTTVNNLDSDIFWKWVAKTRVVQKELAVRNGPDALSPELRAGVDGYVAGYNHYLASVGGSKGINDPACHGKPWVRPITPMDAYLRFYQLIELASKDVVIDGMASAAPPAAAAAPSGSAKATATRDAGDFAPGTHGLPSAAELRALGSRLASGGIGGVPSEGARPTGAMGSNAIAVGSADTRNHHGLLLGNPHFPWSGTERFFQVQLTIPGKLDVEGATLFGVPLVLIGFTSTMAWSHTVSTAYRFTPYQLTLVPGAPTEYLYNGNAVAMTKTIVRVDTGKSSEKHTIYSSRFGPIFNSLEGVPLPWTTATAFAIDDANGTNFRVFNHFVATDEAHSTGQELSILRKYEGIPWVNTIVADRAGRVLYADIGAIPNVTDSEAQNCDTALGAVTYKEDRLPILDGSRKACNWGTNKDSVAPGIFGGKQEPSLMLRSYVENSNDSFWLSNPQHPLTGYPLIIGDTGTARSLRTRSALTMIAERLRGTDGLGRPGFTLRTMEELFYSDRQYGAELVRKQLVSMCRSFPNGMAPTSSGTPIAVGDSCRVLAHWNDRENAGSRGDVLFRDFWERALALQEGPWSHPFSASNPVNTPYGLETSNPQVQQAFGDALSDLSSHHIAYDVTLGARQYILRKGHRITLPGGPGDPDGEFNAIYQNVVTNPGAAPSLGSSYVQVVTWKTGDACPVAMSVLTYSESTNPRSPYYDDQTKVFSEKRFLPEPFCAAAVRRAAIATFVVSGS
jgi:acyl-homoserine-lactone acylase